MHTLLANYYIYVKHDIADIAACTLAQLAICYDICL